MPSSRSSRHHPGAGVVVGQQHVEEVVRRARSARAPRAAAARAPRRAAPAPRGSRSKTPRRLRLDALALLELAVEVRRQRVGHAERRAGVAPGVLVDLALEERLAGRCPCRRGPRPGPTSRGSLSSSAPPSPQTKFLVSWKLRRREPAEAAERLAAPAAEQAVRVVLDDRDVGPVLRAPRGCRRCRRRCRRSGRPRPRAPSRRAARRGAGGRGRGSRGSMSQNRISRALAGEGERASW